MDRPFTERLDGSEESESNGSAVKGTAERSRSHFTHKTSSNGNETDLTAIPMHNFSNGEERDLEIIALHPESGQLGDDDTMTASYLVEGRGFLNFEGIKCITLD